MLEPRFPGQRLPVRGPRAATDPSAPTWIDRRPRDLLLAAALFAWTPRAESQTFQQVRSSAGEARAKWVAITSDGGFVVSGSRASTASETGAYVIKLDADGNSIWETRIGNPGPEIGQRVVQASDGGYFVAGESTSGPSGQEIHLFKLSPSGALEWANAYPGTAAGATGTGAGSPGLAMCRTSAGGVLIGGKLQRPPQVLQAPLLMELDANGAVVWMRWYVDNRYGTQTLGAFSDVEAVSPSVILAAGFTQDGYATSGRDALLVHLGAGGDVDWARTYSTPAFADEALGLATCAGGDVLVCGFNAAVGASGGSFLVRTNPTGALLAARGFAAFAVTSSIEEDSAGNIALPGMGLGAPALITTDASLVLRWSWAYGAPYTGSSAALALAAGGYFLTGSMQDPAAGPFAVHMARTDASGSTGCSERAFSPGPLALSILVTDVDLGSVPENAGGDIAVTAEPVLSSVSWLCASGAITPVCAGDGTLAGTCPCNNQGGTGRGCASSVNVQGALLVASGTASPDTIVLAASGLPSIGGPAAIFLQGDALAAGGIPFGDGLRCVDGNLVRLSTKPAPAGAAQYPEAGNLPISVRGGVTPLSATKRWYQTYYRNAQPTFCPPATFNVTNGVEILW